MLPRILIHPAVSMFDSNDLRIRIDGLVPGESITLFCLVHSNGCYHYSFAYYTADGNGTVDCTKNPSTGGSYKGIEPLGLLWSLIQVPGQKNTASFLPNDVHVPVDYQFYVLDGHRSFSMAAMEQDALCSATSRRHFFHPDISRIEVDEGRIRGTMFLPRIEDQSISKPFAIIDLHGTRGGICEHRAALLAGHGYVTLALAYFRYKDLPGNLENGLDLEYFEEAVDWLLNQSYVRKEGVAVIGSSLGADLAILLACVSPKVKAVVSVNGYHMSLELWPFRHQGRDLPIKRAEVTSEFVVNGTFDMLTFRRTLTDDPECIYQVETSQAQFLFVCGELDMNTDSVYSSSVLMKRLNDHGKKAQGEMMLLPGAGHLVEPPYSPHVGSAFNRTYGMLLPFGGQTEAHAKGQVAFWRKVLKFFQSHLGPPVQMRNFAPVTTSKL